MSDPVTIVALGASTPIGRCAASSAAAVRAGISLFQAHPSMVDTAGEPMLVACADWIDLRQPFERRLEALLLPAVDEVLDAVAMPTQRRLPAELARCAVALALPAARPGLEAGLAQRLLASVCGHFETTFQAAACFTTGHGAGLLGMRAAVAKLARGELDACVLAGVDSYLHPLTLEWLESCDQLHGAGVQNNAWGFVPGEAAGAVLLMGWSKAQALGLPVLSIVLGTGQAIEANCIKTRTVCIGQGLTQAVQDALAALPANERVSDIYCDMNGEPYRADEYGFMCTRSAPSFVSPSDFVAPADCWGDVGAAGGVLHAVLATVAGRKGYAKGPLSLLWASSEGGDRAAALIATRGN
jgi:3-oxoacyl-[acyl-carrier-protein] synthase-1